MSSKCLPRNNAGRFRVTIHHTRSAQSRLQQNPFAGPRHDGAQIGRYLTLGPISGLRDPLEGIGQRCCVRQEYLLLIRPAKLRRRIGGTIWVRHYTAASGPTRRFEISLGASDFVEESQAPDDAGLPGRQQ